MSESMVPEEVRRSSLQPFVRRRRWRSAAVFSVLLTTCTHDSGSRWRGAFDREAWIEDYLQLRAEVARGYANLEWSVATGRIDPYRLNVATLRALEAATTTQEARRALLRFVGAFHDHHFVLHRPDSEPLWGSRLRAAASSPEPSDAARSACKVMGFREKPDAAGDFVLSWGRQFHRLPDRESFPAGILALDDRRFGVLRIGSFDDADYLDTCVKTWPAVRRSHAGPCGDSCQAEFWVAFHQRLLGDLAGRISELSSARVDAILVDVTGNGGGQDWYLQAARLLTPRGIPSRRCLLIKREAAVPHFRDGLKSIASAEESKELSAEARLWLEEGGSRVQGLIQEAHRPCERENLFLRAGYKLPCSGLLSGEYYEDGPFAELPRRARIPEDLKSQLFDSYWGAIPEGSWTGPLLLLVDRDTGSAGELFALILHDAGAATIVGERTAGSGGGFSFGQGEVVLPHSRIRATIPNSVALFKDGRNAREGVEPDVCVDWTPADSPGTRTRKLLRVMEKM